MSRSPRIKADVVGDKASWRRWWPDLRLEVVEDRGAQGVRWKISGPVTGTMEIWCESVLDGFVLHYFLHAEPVEALPADPGALMDLLADLNKARRVAGKIMSFGSRTGSNGAARSAPRPPRGPERPNGRQDRAVASSSAPIRIGSWR